MRHFYLNLEGAARVADKNGFHYASPFEAFKAAQRLARDLADARPELRRNTCVVVTERDHPDDLYCVSVPPGF